MTVGVRTRRGGHRGLEAHVRVNGKLFTKTFPPTTALKVIQDWRRQTVLAHRQPAAVTTVARSFAQDVDAYLAQVATMPTYKERQRHLELWLAALGADRNRATVTVEEVNRVLSRWQLDGLAPQTVRLRRTALAHLYRVLDGPGAANPILRSLKPATSEGDVRAIPYEIIQAILDAMPRTVTRARLALVAFVGLPHKQIARLTPGHIDFVNKTVTLPKRSKGRGVKERTVPLTPQGVAALKEFVKLDAYGSFSGGSLYKSFKRAVLKVAQTHPKWRAILVEDVPGEPGQADRVELRVRPYDLRHSFATVAYSTTGDLATVGRLLGHSDERTTERYARGAVRSVDLSAAKRVGQALEQQLEKPRPKRKTRQKR